MRLSNQAKVAAATIVCLLAQGYIFTYVLHVEPNALVDIAPIIPYILYIYARNRGVWYYDRPLYWAAAIIALTIIDVAPYLYWGWDKLRLAV